MTIANEFKLELTASADGATVFVALHGDIAMKNADTIYAVVAAARDWIRLRRVVVDLTAVASMDLSGSVALTMCRNDLQDAGVGFDVVGTPNDTMQELRTPRAFGTCQRTPTAGTVWRNKHQRLRPANEPPAAGR